MYLSSNPGLTFDHFFERVLREKVARKRHNIARIQERIAFLDEANMTKFVLNYLKVYEPGKYFPRRAFGKQARRKKAELRFLVHDDMDVAYDARSTSNLFIFRWTDQQTQQVLRPEPALLDHSLEVPHAQANAGRGPGLWKAL